MTLPFTPQHHQSRHTHIGLVWERKSPAFSAKADAECSLLVKAGQVVIQGPAATPPNPRPLIDRSLAWWLCILVGVACTIGLAIVMAFHPAAFDSGLLEIIALSVLVGACVMLGGAAIVVSLGVWCGLS